ncbi:hemerythrin domain-containing protein [Streptomyces radiopugnans]|nr:hemerythrin domain-containing protein [Streptomyces radiopugnans]
MGFELSLHAFAEEVVLYPLWPELGMEDANHDARDEHHGMKELLVTLDGGEPGEAEFERALTELIALVRHHVSDEEGEELPSFRAKVGPERMADLGLSSSSPPSGRRRPPRTRTRPTAAAPPRRPQASSPSPSTRAGPRPRARRSGWPPTRPGCSTPRHRPSSTPTRPWSPSPSRPSPRTRPASSPAPTPPCGR